MKRLVDLRFILKELTRSHPRIIIRDSHTHKACHPKNFTDYDTIKHEFKFPQISGHFNFAEDVLDKWAEKEKAGGRAPNPALWWVDGQRREVQWSFEELGFHSRKLANVFTELCQLRQRDRVFLMLPRIPEWWLVNIACLRTGTVLLPGTCQLTARDILHRLRTSGAKCVVTDEFLAPLVDEVAPQCPALNCKIIVSHSNTAKQTVLFTHLTPRDDPMSIFFTSGTTGSPKMTQHSQCSFGIGLTVNGKYWLDLTARDVLWNTSDTGWAKTAWSSVYGAWIQGSCVFVHRMPRFDTSTVLETLSKFPITTFCTAPTAYRMLIQEDMSKYSFGSLQHCVCAGEPINPEVMQKWKQATGLHIYEGYGQTETVLIAGTFKGMDIKPGSIGKASPAYDVQGDPEKTAECYRADFYLTGDRGYMDEDGYLWFVGRADDVILSAGYRIGPFEVENALIEHEAVAESAVVSSPDPIRGEVVKAFIVLTAEYESHDKSQLVADLQTHVKQVTAPYKYPRKIEFVEQLPKTISGKIRRVELRKREWSTKPEAE
uniref:medium-chain acyl-CoA ligase n=1 Tax=Gadus morhua TaxID=8049 RepID=A0A8C5CNY1_GADMO